MRICGATVALGLAVIFLGCGGNGETAPSTDASSQARGHAGYPVPSAAPAKDPLKKLVVKNLEVGDGPVAHWGDEAVIHYVGVYYKTGKIYSQHWGYSNGVKLEKGESFGSGWNKGIQGMRVGGRRELLIPSDLLFGDGDVAYIVELLRVKPGPGSYQQKGPFAAITVKGGEKEPKIASPDRPAPKKLLHRELEPGSGPVAERGDEVAIRYAGAKYETGEVLYGGKTRLFKLGFDGLGAAFERGLEGMRAGARRELIVPSRFLGGSGAVDYVIDLTRLKPASAEQAGG